MIFKDFIITSCNRHHILLILSSQKTSIRVSISFILMALKFRSEIGGFPRDFSVSSQMVLRSNWVCLFISLKLSGFSYRLKHFLWQILVGRVLSEFLFIFQISRFSSNCRSSLRFFPCDFTNFAPMADFLQLISFCLLPRRDSIPIWAMGIVVSSSQYLSLLSSKSGSPSQSHFFV